MQHLQAAVQAHQRDDLDCAEVLVKKILAVNSKNANALHLLGCIYKDLGHSQRAVELIQASIREDGGNPLPYLNLGKIFFAAGQYENAAEFFQESLKRNKQISETWFCLGNAFKKIRTIEDAKNAYQNALQLNPTHAGAASNLGALLAEGGDLEEAEKLLLRALEYSPNNVSLRINYGKLLADKGDNSAAIIQYRIALPFASHSYELHYNLANALKEEGDLQESIASYRKAVELRPDLPDAYLNLANAFMAAEEIDDAIASYQKAIELKPDFVDAFFNMGIALKAEGEIEKAIASFRRVIELKPDFADAYWNLGNALSKEGEIQAATDVLAEYYCLKPIVQTFSFASADSSQDLSIKSQVQVPDRAEFIPSFVSDVIPFGMHLMYVHIPKTGGVRFSNPIFDCVHDMLLKGGWEKYPSLSVNSFGERELSVMASHRIDSDVMRDAIATALSSYDLPALDFSFLTSHGVSSRELSQATRAKFDIEPIRLATWRDPQERLKSALNYLYRTSQLYNLSEGGLGLIRETIAQGDPFLDNAIYRGCFSDFSTKISPDEYYESQVDFLIDIGDFSVMNKIMSSFLSRCRLPNVIVNKKVNVTSSDKKLDVSTANFFAEQCFEAGFLSLDSSPRIEQMVSRELPAEFDLHIDPLCTSLNPLTFVVSTVSDVTTLIGNCLLPTEYLMTDHGQEFLRHTFA